VHGKERICQDQPRHKLQSFGAQSCDTLLISASHDLTVRAECLIGGKFISACSGAPHHTSKQFFPCLMVIHLSFL
jgi:hypothetical protein